MKTIIIYHVKSLQFVEKFLIFTLNVICLASCWISTQVHAHGNTAHNNFIKYNYKDNDEFGPQNWANLESGQDITNFCQIWLNDAGERISGPTSPLNIITSKATLPIRDIEEEFELDYKKPSITFQMQEGLENVPWQFGYPADIYNGLEIRGPRLGLVQVLDAFDPPGELLLSYDFNFAVVSFCDFQEAGKDRSSHQLDGKRFPLEIDLIFFSEPRDIGIDNYLPPKNNNSKIVMVSILGEAEGDDDNELFEPVIEAAKSYHAGDFDMDDTDDDFSVNIKSPFSPTWLIPKESTYYYYTNGSFPVPPCFPIDQVYVIHTPIKISKKQLQKLTTLSTEREPDKVFSCTHGLLQNEILANKVLFNPYFLRFVGNDNRPQDIKAGAAMQSESYLNRFGLISAVILIIYYELNP